MQMAESGRIYIELFWSRTTGSRLGVGNHMICKHCGMESAATDRCSFCGHSLAAASEASPTPASSPKTERPPAVSLLTGAAEPAVVAVSQEPTVAEPPMAVVAEVPAPSPAAEAPMPAPLLNAAVQPKVSKPPVWTPDGPRKPAPAIMPKVSERAKRGPQAVKPIAEWVPWERVPVAEARPIDVSEAAGQAAHISMNDPDADHKIFMQQAKQPAQRLNADDDEEDEAAVAAGTPTPAVPSMWSRIEREDTSINLEEMKEPDLPLDVLLKSVGAVVGIALVAAVVAYFLPSLSAIPLVV